MVRQAVIFVFYDEITHRVLAEKRAPDANRFPNQITFPSGVVEKDEKNDLTKTLVREIKEELGVTPTSYIKLPFDSTFLDDEKGDTVLHPYLITKWEGILPDEIIDKGNRLIWQTFEEALETPIQSKMRILEAVQSYLKKN